MEISSFKHYTHLVRGTNEDTLLASLAPILMLILIPHDFPRGSLPKAPSFYAIVSLSGLGFGCVRLHMISPLGVGLGQVR